MHDRGELDDGRLWFAMKQVEGRTFSSVIHQLHRASASGVWSVSKDGWTLRRAVEALARLSDAVAYAHSCGILHRDLKPANLMVGSFGAVYVMDWGLASDLAVPPVASDREGLVDEGAEVRVTLYGQALGTPSYVAPEQARGEHDRVGPAADVYSLGCVLFQLLVGRPPYRGSPASVLRQVLSGPPPRVAAAIGRNHPPLPDELVALSDHATEPNPARRPADAGAFADALRS